MNNISPMLSLLKVLRQKEKGELKSRADFMECWEAWLREGEIAFKVADSPEGN